MDEKKVLEVIALYRAEFQKRGIPKSEYPYEMFVRVDHDALATAIGCSTRWNSSSPKDESIRRFAGSDLSRGVSGVARSTQLETCAITVARPRRLADFSQENLGELLYFCDIALANN